MWTDCLLYTSLLIEQPDLYDDMTEGDPITVTVNHHVDYKGRQYPIASLPDVYKRQGYPCRTGLGKCWKSTKAPSMTYSTM